MLDLHETPYNNACAREGPDPLTVIDPFDQSILTAVNTLAGRSYLLDHSLEFIANSNLTKGLPFICLLLAYWFRGGDPARIQKTREHVTCTILAGIFAILIARLLALLLPFRVRPRFNSEAHFQVPATWDHPTLIDWSSFPSDHAVLFATLATGVLFISRRAGIAGLLYVVLIIGFPRVYLGFHYPSDVLAGMCLGIALGATFNASTMCASVSRLWHRLEAAAPAVFYPALFIVCEQIATLFDDVRHAASLVSHAVHHFW